MDDIIGFKSGGDHNLLRLSDGDDDDDSLHSTISIHLAGGLSVCVSVWCICVLSGLICFLLSKRLYYWCALLWRRACTIDPDCPVRYVCVCCV